MPWGSGGKCSRGSSGKVWGKEAIRVSRDAGQAPPAQLQKNRASSQRQRVGGGKRMDEAHWQVPAVTQHQQDSLQVGPGIGLGSSAIQPSEQHNVLQLVEY